MLNTLIKSALGLALGFVLVTPAMAMPIPPTPPAFVSGTFDFDNDVEEFEFSIATTSNVTIESIGYAGGPIVTNPNGSFGAGGFDTVLSLFDSSGTFITANDDGRGIVDPATGSAFDSLIEETLTADTYTVVVSQFANFFNGGIGDDISLGFEFDGPPDNFTSLFCSNGSFCDVGGNNRSNFFAVNIVAQAQAVPEPSTLALLGFGLVGAGLAYRRRQQG